MTWRVEMLNVAILALMFSFAALSWPHVPERIPIHWNVFGKPDALGDRTQGLLQLPLVAAALYLLLAIAPLTDRERANRPGFATPYNVIRTLSVAILGALQAGVVVSAAGNDIPMASLGGLLAGSLLLVVAAFLPRIPPNRLLGVRTPWTLRSDLSWRRTNWLGAWLLLVLGVTFLLAGITSSPAAFAIGFGAAAAGLLGLTLYSYIVWRSDPARRSA